MRFVIWIYTIFTASVLYGAWGSSVAFSAYLFFQLYFALRRSKNWINPIFFYSFYLLIATLANLRIIYLFESGVFLRSFKYAVPELFDEASLIWALGNFMIIEAYQYKLRLKLPVLEWNLTGFNRINFLFWASIALIFHRFWLPFSLPGAFQNVFNLLPLLGILMHARIAEIKANRGLFLKALILLALATGHSILYSFLRMEMIIPSLVFVLGTLSSARNIWVFRAPRFYPLYGFLVLFLLFFSTFGANRTGIARGFARLTQLQQIIESDDGLDSGASLSPFERSSTISQVSAVSGLVRDNGHYKGRASEPLLTALIPRFLWPEKPKIALGVWFAFEIGAALQRADGWYNNSINMTIPGNLFLDFGWLGLLLGCWVTGAFISLLWKSTHFADRPLNFTGSLFAGYLLYTCFTGLGANLQILITLLAVYLIILVLDRIFHIHFFRQRQYTLPQAGNWAARTSSKDA